MPVCRAARLAQSAPSAPPVNRRRHNQTRRMVWRTHSKPETLLQILLERFRKRNLDIVRLIARWTYDVASVLNMRPKHFSLIPSARYESVYSINRRGRCKLNDRLCSSFHLWSSNSFRFWSGRNERLDRLFSRGKYPAEAHGHGFVHSSVCLLQPRYAVVARQSGWEGGDDQECILTVAAD